MQKFATEFDNDDFLQHDVAKLPWSSITTIIDQVKNKILSEMPEFLENTLPSIEDIEKRLEEDSERI